MSTVLERVESAEGALPPGECIPKSAVPPHSRLPISVSELTFCWSDKTVRRRRRRTEEGQQQVRAQRSTNQSGGSNLSGDRGAVPLALVTVSISLASTMTESLSSGPNGFS